jgi:hypothetical protein
MSSTSPSGSTATTSLAMRSGNGRHAAGADVEARGVADSARPRRRAAEIVKPAPIPEPIPSPPPDEPEDEALFDDLEVPTEAVRPDGIPAIDSDLTPDEKQEFIALLNKFMPLDERALQLVKLARFSDTKRAPVGLRAIQEINTITGIRGERPTEAVPMFALPANTSVSVQVTKVIK